MFSGIPPFSLGQYSSSFCSPAEQLGHVVTQKNCLAVSKAAVHHSVFLPVGCEGSDLSTSPTNLGPSHFGHANGCGVVYPVVLICILLFTKF